MQRNLLGIPSRVIFLSFLLIGFLLAALLVPNPQATNAQDTQPLPTPTEIVIGVPPDVGATWTPDLRPETATPDPNATPIPIPVQPEPVLDPNALTPTPEGTFPARFPTEVPALPEFTPVPLPQTESNNERVVSVGETLFTLSAQSGFNVNDLGQLNYLTNPNLLVNGQKLKLPAPVSPNIRLHRVTSGETLIALAAQYNVSLALLRQANSLVCGSCLVVGQLLRVPQPPGQIISNLPAPFESVVVAPFVPRQGQTLVLRVRTSLKLESLVGSWAGNPLKFIERESDGSVEYIGLSGVEALQAPGVYSVTLRAVLPSGEASAVSGRVQVAQGNFAFERLSIPAKYVPLLDPVLNQAEHEEMLKVQSEWTANQYWKESLQLPIPSRFASYFGTRRSFNRGILDTYHSGVDLVATVGTPVKAAAAGRVAAVTTYNVRGNVIMLDHGRGVFTTYCHLSQFNVEVGQVVDVGQVIGYSGNTGRSLGPHLHWELAIGGVTVNPLAWVDEPIP